MSYVILDSNSVWGRYKRILNSRGIPVIGKTETTTGALAAEIVIYNASIEGALTGSIPDIRQLSPKGAVLVLRSIAMNLEEEGKLEYYKKKVLDDSATCNEIYRVVNLLRLEEVKDSADFSSRPGLKDLKLIWDSFEKELKDRNLYDPARMLAEAVKLLRDDSFKSGFMASIGSDVIECFHEEDLTYMEREMEKLLNVKDITKEIEDDLKSKREAPEIHCYKAYGRENELRKIVEIIKAKGISFGDINIFISSRLYEGYIQAVLGREGIPCSFISGRAPTDSYYRLMNDILEFAKNGFYYKDYRRICRNPLLSNVCYGMNLQNDADIGWSKELYIVRADSRIEELNNEIELIENDKDLKDDEKTGKKYYRNRKKQYYSMMRDLALVFENDDTTLSSFYNSLIDFLKNYTNAKNPERKSSLADLKNTQGEISDISERTGGVSLEKAVLFFSDYVNGISITDSEKSDAVSVITMGSHYFSDRKHNFFVGLSFGDFSLNTADSPVMSDNEMLQIFNSEDVCASRKNEKKAQNVRSAIDFASGETYLSYTYYDTANLVDMTPHDIYVEYLNADEEEEIRFTEIGKGDLKFKMADYKVFASSETKEEESDSDEEAEEEGIEAPAEAEAESQEETDESTEDQEDDVSEETTESQEKEAIYMSATGKIQTLLNCKREYAYKYIYGLLEEDEVKISEREWLSAADKGLLAHEVLEKYLGEVQLPGEDGKIETDFNETVFTKIFEDVCERFHSTKPIRSEDVVKNCKEKYRTGLTEYLKSVHKEFANDGWKIAGLETNYTIEGLLSDAIKEIEPEADIPQINAIARIDRVDKKALNGNTIYRIADYKSGSRERIIDEIDEKTLIQHELYMMVLEKLIDEGKLPSGTVESFEFHFIYEEKDENKKALQKPDPELRKLFLKEILNSFTDQTTPPPYKSRKERCKFCEYGDICCEFVEK